MGEIRTDWLTGRTVILAENRAKRPYEFTADTATTICRFCAGQEAFTPPAVYTQVDAQGQWSVRVVPNKFPALMLDEVADTAANHPAFGAHEVVIESARHVDRVSALSAAEFGNVLVAYQERLDHWHGDGRFEYGLVFKNLGPRAGASMAHLHSQLIALPQSPPTAGAEFDRATQYFAEQSACPYCRMIHDERHARERIVLDQDGFIAFCPPASLQPWEVWLMPAEHEPWFERRPRQNGADPLTENLYALVHRIETIVPESAYNLLVRTAPWRDAAAAYGHWRIEILPRVNALAGMELATGIHINPLSPTRAAERLRSG